LKAQDLVGSSVGLSRPAFELKRKPYPKTEVMVAILRVIIVPIRHPAILRIIEIATAPIDSISGFFVTIALFAKLLR
jgi:hypothetical protein